jgi:hypothetical protein
LMLLSPSRLSFPVGTGHWRSSHSEPGARLVTKVQKVIGRSYWHELLSRIRKLLIAMSYRFLEKYSRSFPLAISATRKPLIIFAPYLLVRCTL